MNKKAIAATGLFGAIAVAGAVGLRVSGGNKPRGMAKRAGKLMDRVGHTMQGVGHKMQHAVQSMGKH